MIDALPILAPVPAALPDPAAGDAAPGFAALLAAALPPVVPVGAAVPPPGDPAPVAFLVRADPQPVALPAIALASPRQVLLPDAVLPAATRAVPKFAAMAAPDAVLMLAGSPSLPQPRPPTAPETTPDTDTNPPEPPAPLTIASALPLANPTGVALSPPVLTGALPADSAQVVRSAPAQTANVAAPARALPPLAATNIAPNQPVAAPTTPEVADKSPVFAASPPKVAPTDTPQAPPKVIATRAIPPQDRLPLATVGPGAPLPGQPLRPAAATIPDPDAAICDDDAALDSQAAPVAAPDNAQTTEFAVAIAVGPVAQAMQTAVPPALEALPDRAPAASARIESPAPIRSPAASPPPPTQALPALETPAEAPRRPAPSAIVPPRETLNAEPMPAVVVPVAGTDSPTAAAMVSQPRVVATPAVTVPAVTVADVAASRAETPAAALIAGTTPAISVPPPAPVLAPVMAPVMANAPLRARPLPLGSDDQPADFNPAATPLTATLTTPDRMVASPETTRRAAAEPHQPSLAIASDTLGAVTVGIDGGPQDLRLRLDANPLAAGRIAAEAPRLVADLAAQGVRLHTLDIGGQSLNPSFGQQPQGQQPQGQQPQGQSRPPPTAFFPDARPAPPRSDRYA